MSAEIERPPDAEVFASLSGGFIASLSPDNTQQDNTQQLAALPLGARLVLRCRKDWRDATVVRLSPENVTLSVCAPMGRTYRVRRPPDSLLSFHGSIPVLGEGSWRTGFARYDTRW